MLVGKINKHYNDYQDREVLRSLGTHPWTGALPATYYIEEDITYETVDPETIEALIEYRTAEDDIELNDLRRITQDMLDSMTRREAKILRLRFGIGLAQESTLDEIGHVFNCTRERIRQIEAKALRKMRHFSRSNQLRVFVNDDATCSLWDRLLEPVPTIDDYEGWGYIQAVEFLERDMVAWRKRNDEVIKKLTNAKKNLRGLI
jgi:RNA polymerase sigma factor (sigma-70 family)